MPLQFENVYGKTLTELQMQQTAKLQRKPKVVKDKAETNKGFRVVGYAPGALDEARAAHERASRMADESGGAPIKPFDENVWRTRTKKKPIAKPFAIHSSAVQCADLSRKAGWTEVEVIELVDRVN